MKRKEVSAVMLGLGWMVSLGAVFVLGILSAFAFHLGPGAGEGASSDLSLAQRELALVIERYAGSPADWASIQSVSSGENLPEQVEQALRAIMRQSDREERQMAAMMLLRGLPSRKVMAAIRLLQEIPMGPGRDQVLGAFIQSWAAEDGRRAIAFATSLASPTEREMAIQSVLRGWSRTRPEEAWAWVIEHAGSSRRAERGLEIIVSNLSRADRRTAIELLDRLPVSDFQNRMALAVMEQILETDPYREAIRWLGEFPGNSGQPAAVYLAGSWARSEPEAAALWLHGTFPGEIAGLGGVLREWVYVNPEAAADWVWGNFGEEDRRALMDAVSEEWIGNDGPAPVAEWLNSHGPDPSLDGAIEALALATASMDPATALVWAQSVTDPDARSMLEIMIGRQWIRMAPETAEENLPVLLESESARAALLAPEYVPETYEEYGEYPAEDTGLVDEEAPLEEEPLEPVQ